MNLVRKILLLQDAIIEGKVAARSHKNSENKYKPAISTALSDGLVGLIVWSFRNILRIQTVLRTVMSFFYATKIAGYNKTIGIKTSSAESAKATSKV